jgi:polysaccharide export outer membrane protein
MSDTRTCLLPTILLVLLAGPLICARAVAAPAPGVHGAPGSVSLAVAGAAGAPAAPVAGPALDTDAEYQLGAGDIIHITVFQNPDLTIDTRVSENGQIAFPLIGSVKIGGLTIRQAEQLIATRLRRGHFVQQPQVNILPTQIVGSQVAVLGQVNKPGRYPLATLDTRVSDMLATAGGIAPDGADSVWLIGVRNGHVIRKRLDTTALFIQGSAADVEVHSGDVLFVDRQPLVYIYGEVQKAGAFRLERNMTVMQALAEGGGLTPKGTQRGIRIHRRMPDGRIEEITPSLDDLLQPNDVIYVRASVF